MCLHSQVYTEVHREHLQSQLTCFTLKVSPTVFLYLFTLLGGFTMLSVSQSINTAFPMKLSEGYNAS